MTIEEAKKKLLSENPGYAIETEYEVPKYFIFSLRHESLPPGSLTGGACYLVDKKTKRIEVVSIYDERTRK